MAGDGIVRRPEALVVQDHHRGARDRLGHREDAEEGVGRKRLAARQVLRPHSVDVHEAAAAGDQGDRASQHAAVDQPPHLGVDGAQRL